MPNSELKKGTYTLIGIDEGEDFQKLREGNGII